MTFTAVGSFITTDQKTFTWAPTAVGQVFPLIAITTAAAQPVTAVASSNATWVQCGTGQTLNGQSFTAWKGVATSTSSATVTLTSAAANGNLRNFGHAFSASGGGSNVTFDALFTLDATTGATTSWPAATPGHGTGELLFGAEFNGGTAVSGSTSGYTYNVDATHGNGSAFDLSVGAATHPVWGDSDARSVLVILLYEAVPAHTATASLTVTPSMSAAASRKRLRSASLTVTPSFSAHASSSATPGNTILDEAGDPIFDEAGGFILDESDNTSHTASATLTVVPSFAAVAVVLTHTPSASLTVQPSFSAVAARKRSRSASLLVTPSFAATDVAAHVRSASLTVTPVMSASRVRAAVRSAGLTVRPVLAATALHVAGAPPGYPDGNLGATVEFFNGTGWVDITAAALPDGQQYGSVKSGQTDGSQQPTPAAMPATWDNPDYSLSPRNTAGPFFGQLRQNTPVRVSFNSPYGAYLRLEADDSDQAAVADTSALHVTGSMEVRLGARLSDYRACVLAARQDTGGTPSWAWLLNANGTQTFKWWDSGGTLRSVTSDAVAAVSWLAYRVTLNASSGTVTFYVSTGIDGTWVQLGDAASGTSGSASSVRAGNCPLTVGWSAAASQQLCGQVYGLRLYSGIGGTVVADAGFPVVIPGSTSWTDAAGRTWGLSGGAEVTGRDYRGHFELASSQPAADVSSSLPRVAVQLSGRLRRLQQGSAPTADSAMKRAILSQAGSLIPVDYWTLEDGIVAKQFGAALGTQLLTANLGTVQAAADSSFEASAALPQLNGDSLSATVDTYTGATAWTVRFLCKIGQLPAAATTQRLASVNLASGTVRRVDLIIDDTGGVGLKGFNSGGGSVFTTSEFGGFDVTNPKWFSIEGTASGGNTIFNAINLAPGATSGEQLGGTLPSVSGAPANVTSVVLNPDLFFTDTAVGHLTVQKAWTTLFALGKPLNAWRTELTADRFARVCAEQGITCRILGRPSVTQAMGPQPRGSTWVILRDCANTEQSIIYEPYDVLGLCLRTRESMGAQAPGMTLSFADSDLPGDVQPADDDSGFLNDITGQMPDGTTWRAVLDDGSAKSVSEPKDGGMGRYTGSVPFPLNVADAGELPSAVAFYLGRVSVDEQRFRNVTANFGIPGAPVAAAARLRPGDLIKITDVPALYQTADIEQLAMGRTEPFGPGRRISWDCIPWSPYSP